MQHIPSGYPEPHDNAPSLANWTGRLALQLRDLLDPTFRNLDTDPTEQLTSSLDDKPNWTLLALVRLAKDSQESSIRTLALVTIRRFIIRQSLENDELSMWDVVSVATQKEIQATLLQCVTQMSSPDVSPSEERNSLVKTVVEVSDALANRGYPWPELFATLSDLLSSHQPAFKQELFYRWIYESPLILADEDPGQVVQHLKYGLLLPTQHEQEGVVGIAIEAIKATVAVLSTDDRSEGFGDLVADMLEVVQNSATSQAYKNLESALLAFMEIYNSPYCQILLSSYIHRLLAFCNSLLSPAVPEGVRNAAIEILASTAELLPSSDVQDYVPDYQEVSLRLLAMMTLVTIEGGSDPNEDAFWDGDVDDTDEEDLKTYAVAESALGRIAAAIGGRSVLDAVYGRVREMLESDSAGWMQKHAAISALAALAEHCAKEYKQDLEGVMRLVLPMLQSQNYRLAYAGVYALAEFCESLAGTVQERLGDSILPLLLQILSSDRSPSRLIAYTCASLVNYTESLLNVPSSLSSISLQLFQQLHGLLASGIDPSSPSTSRRVARKDVKMRAMTAVAQLGATLARQSPLQAEIYNGVMQPLWHYLDGDTDEELKARAIDCVSLLATSVEKEVIAQDAQRLMESLARIQANHPSSEDPCYQQVLIGLVRMAEVLESDFLPYIDTVVPPLLMAANVQADHLIADPRLFQEENADAEMWILRNANGDKSEGTVGINTASLAEKIEAMQLLGVLASALGPHLASVGSSQSTTGEWTSYAETMVTLATDLLAYEHSDDVRAAAAVLLPPLAKGIKETSAYSDSFKSRLIEAVIPALLSALSYEDSPSALSSLFASTSEIVLAVPDAFSTTDAATFVHAVREQVEELQRRSAELRHTRPSPEELDESNAADRDNLEYMSQALRAVIQTARAEFPIASLFSVFNRAIYGQLKVDGEREWALRFVSDLIEFASPASVPWTTGFLPRVLDGLKDSKAEIRQICAYIVGVAAVAGGGNYAQLLSSSVPLLCTLASQKPDPEDEVESLAFENVISALGKLVANDVAGALDSNAILPLWLAGLPLQYDVSEMEPCYSLLLDLIAREHTLVSPIDSNACQHVVHIVTSALNNPNLPAALHDPLSVGLRSYVSKTPAEVQQEVARRYGSTS